MRERAFTNISYKKGLSSFDIAKRIALGETNEVKKVSTRSYLNIIKANILTRFNAIMSIALFVILIFGSIRDALFGLVFISNILIGIIQEIRAKWTLDKLTLINAPKVRVVRDSLVSEIPVESVVMDDIIQLSTGDQVVADMKVLVSDGLEIDESMLTGESAPIPKKSGDLALSGSFVVAGTGRLQVTALGENSYAYKIAKEARRFKLVRSELQDGINKILRVITWIMVPVGIVHLIIQLRIHDSFYDAAPGIVAGIISMVPMGLVLLTSVAFAVSIISLGKIKVLVQELPAVEVLARVDTICFDKTGTLTYGKLAFKELIPLDNNYNSYELLLGNFCQSFSSVNNTMQAISQAFPISEKWKNTGTVPFSSIRKWSSISFVNEGTWILGAPEVLLEKINNNKTLYDRIRKIADSGYRVLLLAQSEVPITKENLPNNIIPKFFILLEEQIKGDARETLKYFNDQKINIKILSGDNPATVAAIAKESGVKDTGKPFNARFLTESHEELAEIINKTTVFGRVSPEQKKSIVSTLQLKGHVVAMVGDGVNDVLALKKADIGITIGSASSSAKAVSQLVLIDGKFSRLSKVVEEGRRVTGNIERVANLFITKTIYATFLSIIIGLFGLPFMLLPRHITLVDALTIGTPAFFLSLAHTIKPYSPGFVKRVLKFAFPTGLMAGLSVITVCSLHYVYNYITFNEMRTMAVLSLVIVSMWGLAALARPYNWWKIILLIAMVSGLIVVFAIPWLNSFFALAVPNWNIIFEISIIGFISIILLEIFWCITGGRPESIK